MLVWVVHCAYGSANRLRFLKRQDEEGAIELIWYQDSIGHFVEFRSGLQIWPVFVRSVSGFVELLSFFLKFL